MNEVPMTTQPQVPSDAIAALLKEEPVLAYQFEGIRYDCGNKLGYLQATVQFALRHPEVRDDFRRFLQTLPLLSTQNMQHMCQPADAITS
jgi:UTP-glucose-1-phosphate uridylyltransferase